MLHLSLLHNSSTCVSCVPFAEMYVCIVIGFYSSRTSHNEEWFLIDLHPLKHTCICSGEHQYFSLSFAACSSVLSKIIKLNFFDTHLPMLASSVLLEMMLSIIPLSCNIKVNLMKSKAVTLQLPNK